LSERKLGKQRVQMLNWRKGFKSLLQCFYRRIPGVLKYRQIDRCTRFIVSFNPYQNLSGSGLP
jgi:hypothetical protein